MSDSNIQPTCYLVSPLPKGKLPGQENTATKAFAQSVLVPGLVEEGFRVITAEEAFVEAIGASSLAERATLSAQEWLEKADLVVIDMTQESPNSVFMIGYRNALDKPCIVYTQGADSADGDIAGVRYVRTPPRDLSPSMKVELFKEQIRQVLSRNRSTPTASTAPSSATFGFAPDAAPFGGGPFADKFSVPAADRYVSARDNQPLINEIREKVAALTNAVSENRENDFDDKEGRLAELAALDLILSKPQISVPLVEKILSDTVKYLAKRFADAAIGQIAVEVLKLAASALWTRL